jgi:hypothetical protein
MADLLTSGQKITQRTPGQWSKVFLAVPEYHTIFTAELDTVPTSNDRVYELDITNEVGDIADVLPDMTLYVGTVAGGYDLGFCRIRIEPISGTLYIGVTSEIMWDTVGTIYLTVVDDYSLWAKPVGESGGLPLMDNDIAYTDQHENFDPVPCMGGHRVKRLVGASVDVRLGPSDDTAPFVFDSTITGRVYSVAGATLDDATAVNPQHLRQQVLIWYMLNLQRQTERRLQGFGI